jgi:hypothetical protein
MGINCWSCWMIVAFAYKGIIISAAVLNVHGWYCDKITESRNVHWSTCKSYSLLSFMIPAVFSPWETCLQCLMLLSKLGLAIRNIYSLYYISLMTGPDFLHVSSFFFLWLLEDMLLGICLQIKCDCTSNRTPYVYYRCSSFVIWRHPEKLAAMLMFHSPWCTVHLMWLLSCCCHLAAKSDRVLQCLCLFYLCCFLGLLISLLFSVWLL